MVYRKAKDRWRVVIHHRRLGRKDWVIRGRKEDAEAFEAQQRLNLEKETALGTIPLRGSPTRSNAPTLKEWLRGRYAERSRLLHRETTERVVETSIRYLVSYLGEQRIDEVGDPAIVNRYIETRLKDGPKSFTLRKDGQPRRPVSQQTSNGAINKDLSVLRAALNLAFNEHLLSSPPRIGMLPEDDTRPILPPSDTEIGAILAEAANMRSAAALFSEAIELAIETGLRKEEEFRLTWGSVDWSLGPNREGAIRVEEQSRGRLLGGRVWKPKNRRYRIVPLSPKAREILTALRDQTKPSPHDLVIPNTDGSPYVRLNSATKGSGTSTWRILKEATGHTVRWHDLRHLFAVRCLQRGIPISFVSQWLGHSDINLTVKRYGRFAGEAREQWVWINTLAEPIDTVAQRRSPGMTVVAGGARSKPSR